MKRLPKIIFVFNLFVQIAYLLELLKFVAISTLPKNSCYANIKIKSVYA